MYPNRENFDDPFPDDGPICETGDVQESRTQVLDYRWSELFGLLR